MNSNNKQMNSTAVNPPSDRIARDVIRSARKAALATLDRTSGHPYASLVTVATDMDGTPLLLISRLALHTQNIANDDRASLLFDASGADGDPLAGGRVTVVGRARTTSSTSARRRFLARHPEAAMYADFPDFAFYELEVERAHYIGGFGRIVPLERSSIVVDVSAAASLSEAEAEIVEHMNDDHADAVALYATRIADAPGGAWRMTGIDPEGCDLVFGGEVRRISFAEPITTPAMARKELARLAAKARAEGGQSSA